MKRLNIKHFQSLAKAKNGLCLSPNYHNIFEKLKWQCEKGHVWKSSAQTIKRGSWCPKCSGRHKTIDDLQELAAQKEGKCLAGQSFKANQKILWECKAGHKWKASTTNIARGRWCPTCGTKSRGDKQRDDIDNIRKIASPKGFKLLTEEYVNSQTDMEWECGKGHRWKAVAASIVRGTGCPYCAGKHPTIHELRTLAKLKGGDCLSEKYKKNTTKLLWKCGDGHEWHATPNMVKRGTWCPICSEFQSERLCRAIFEKIFECGFKKIRPRWLKNKNGKIMELDGYNKSLKIAFEYNGPQHYTLHNLFTPTKESLSTRRESEGLKKELCAHHGIRLFVIPYTVKIEKLPREIERQAKIFGVNTGYNFAINIDSIGHGNREYFDRAKRIAEEHKGALLSKKINFKKDKLRWQCSQMHIWESTLESVERGSWCTYCSGKGGVKFDYNFVKKEVENSGEYFLLSTGYENWKEKLKIAHKICGNIIFMNFSGWRTGYRCKYCARRAVASKQRFSHEKVKGLIEKEGEYQLISDTYINANTKIKILHLTCKNEFEMTLGKWSMGRRCSKC